MTVPSRLSMTLHLACYFDAFLWGRQGTQKIEAERIPLIANPMKSKCSKMPYLEWF